MKTGSTQAARTSIWSAIAAAAAAAAVAAAMLAGCGNARPPSANEDGTQTMISGGLSCGRDGARSSCTIELGRYDNVVSCAKGERTCNGSTWGPCTANTLQTASYFTVPAPVAAVAPDATSALAGRLRTRTISSTPTSCIDNPCDQYCQKYPDVPDAALTGDSATTYPDKNLTFQDLPNGNPPDGFVKKGNDDNGVCGGCYPASPFPYSGLSSCQEACQFDSHCTGNGTDGCTMFGDGESNACTGIDITTPLVCQIPAGAPANVGMRKLSVCNRGSVAVPANSGIVCWKFPGGQPQFPNNNPLDSANNSAGPVDTFNEAIDPGKCIVHVVDDSVFGNSGTTSVMCNVRQSYTSVVWVPGQGALPAFGSLPTSTLSSGTWSNDLGARDIGVSSASVALASSTATAGAGTTSATAGWSNLANVGASADGSVATVQVGKTRTASGSASVATAKAATWTATANAQGAANATIATATLSLATTTSAALTATGPSNDAAQGGSWVNIANAGSSVDASAVATGTIPAKSGGNPGTIGMFLTGPTLPGATTARVVSVSATVVWSTNDASHVTGRVDLFTNAGSTLGPTKTLVAPANVLGGKTFNWTSTDLATAGLTVGDVANGKFLRVYAENTDNIARTLSVDYVSVTVEYETGTSTGTLRFTNFDLGVPTGATNVAVTVTAKAGATAAAGVSGSYTVSVYKAGQATLVGTSAATVQTGNTALANLVYAPAGLTGTDLQNANLAVDVTATTTSASTFTSNVDAVTVAVTYDAPDTATSATLSAFGLGALVPAGSTIESITTSVGLSVDVVNGSKNNLGFTTKIGAATLSTVSVNPTTSVAQYTATYTNSAGTYTQADLANLTMDLNADTSSNTAGFVGNVDNASITVKYAGGLSATLALSGFGLSVPAGSTDISANVQANWASSATTTQLCFQVYDASTNTNIGTAHCTTAGATPSVLSTLESDGFALTQTQAANLAVNVTATRPAGGTDSTSTLDYVAVQMKYTTPPTLTGVDECNVNNNWTVSKKNPPLYCPAVTTYFDFYKTRVFDGVCPDGTNTRWRLFGWDSVDPNSTKIEFRLRSFAPTVNPDGTSTCTPLAAAYSDPPASISTAQSAPTDTQVCSLTATPTATCPANVGTYLGGVPQSDLRCLQMDAHGYADSLGAPTLNGWTVTYDCLPTE